MASAVAYRVPQGALMGWMETLAEDAVDFDGPFERLGETAIRLRDPDGMAVELIESAEAAGEGSDDGFHSVTLWLADPGPTARLLTDVFGYEARGEEKTGGETRLRLASRSGARGSAVDLVRRDEPSIGRQGRGTIHHVAFRADSDEVQLEWRERLRSAGFDVTPVIDRQYFNAIYFREPGGVLFEIATDPPGFVVDEPVETLGEALKLPPQYEAHRAEIERRLPELRA
jgi:glyoxalase family protein